MNHHEELEAARALVAEQAQQAEQRQSAIETLATRVKDLSVSARSPRGEVTVTAAPSGRVLSIDLSPTATDLESAELARILTETLALAQHRAAQAAADLSTEVLGDDSAFAQQLRADAGDAFPPPAGSDSIGYR